MAKKQWPKLGTIRKKNGKSYLVLDKDVTIIYKGKEVDLGEYRTTFFKNQEGIKDSLEALHERDYINEQELNKQLEAIEDKNIIYEVYIPQD